MHQARVFCCINLSGRTCTLLVSFPFPLIHIRTYIPLASYECLIEGLISIHDIQGTSSNLDDEYHDSDNSPPCIFFICFVIGFFDLQDSNANIQYCCFCNLHFRRLDLRRWKQPLQQEQHCTSRFPPLWLKLLPLPNWQVHQWQNCCWFHLWAR